MKTKMITGFCDICKIPITPAKSQAQFNRSLGFHKRMAHNIQGYSATMEGKRRAARQRHWKQQGLSDRQIAEREALFQQKHAVSAPLAQPVSQPEPYQKAYRRTTKKGRSDAEPIGLEECPICGARFYVTRGIER